MFRYLLFLTAIFLTSCATPLSAKRNDVFLIKAEIISYGKFHQIEFNDQDSISMDVIYDVNMRLQKTFIGDFHRKDFSTKLVMHSKLRKGYWSKNLILVGNIDSNGNINVYSWRSSRYGIDIPESYAVKNNIKNDLEELIKSGKVKINFIH